MSDHARVRGIVLAGVHAWDEAAIDRVCSRPLLPLAGRPLIWYVLDRLRRAGVERVSVCANSDTRHFRDCLGDGGLAHLALDYYEDHMPRGPAGCLRDAAFDSEASEFLVMDGTLIADVDLSGVLGRHRESGADMTVVVSAGPAEAGEVLRPAGVYAVSRRAVELIPAKGYQDIKEMWIPRLYAKGLCVVPYVVPPGAALHVRSAASYLATVGSVLRQCAPELSGDTRYRKIGQAWVHRSSKVESLTSFIGSVLVGPDCQVRDGVKVFGPTIIGPGCVLGQNAVLTHSVLLSACSLSAGAIVDHCTLMSGCRVAAGEVVRDAILMGHKSGTANEHDFYWWLPQGGPSVRCRQRRQNTMSERQLGLVPDAAFLRRPFYRA